MYQWGYIPILPLTTLNQLVLVLNFQEATNVNITVDNTILKDAIIPLKFDLVGKNDYEVYAKSIDLERRKYNVEHDVNAFYPIKDLSPK